MNFVNNKSTSEKKNGGGGGVLGERGNCLVHVSEQTFQVAFPLFKENNCAKLF